MKRVSTGILFAFGMLAFSACKEEIALPDNLAAFTTATQGIDAEEATVQIALSRATDVAIPITIQLTPTLVTYDKEFVTEPAATNNIVTATVPAGQSSVSIKVKKKANVFLNGDESLTMKITSIGTPVLAGVNTETKLSFAAITSTGSKLTGEGKTTESNYTNNVYFDLSANATTLSARKSWNLGFYHGGQYRVILNPGYQSSAAPTTKTDIGTVTLADTASVPELNFAPGGDGTLALADYWDGDLTKTVFAEVSATDAQNKVYLVSFEGSKTKDKWFKVKVNRNGEGYKVQFARIGETAIKTVDIAKNADFNFSFLSLETGATVTAEPRKINWDIQWGYSTSNAGTTPPTPYWFQDFILLNYAAGAEAAEVLESTVTYDAYAEANIATSTFLKTRDAIGSKWRVTSGATLGIRRDRFYVIKDPSGNVYKLKFVSMGLASDGGERGKPVIEYKLVKKK
ncbi:HmuY family protein [Runella sp.]|uniref:HmuY family protein n=1 Tax=Runella sp. TaxID=1960881 RepID=UPI003D0DBFA6